MLVLLRSTDGNPDSRLQKYVDALDNAGVAFFTICWDRNDNFSSNSKKVFYKKKALYGSGWRNILKLLGFNFFILKILILRRNEYKSIHACDFDTILPAMIMKLLFCKKVIYDIFDWYVDSREMGWAKHLVLLLERFYLKNVDVTIICEEERAKQLCCTPRKLWVLPNIPNIHYAKSLKSKPSDFLRLSYVGVFSAHRGLDKIISFLEMYPNYHLDIAGFGELEPMIKSAAERCRNIHYWGSVDYDKGLSIMENSDIILAIYETSIPNHIYAAPNKYYEGLFLGKPILTTKGTYVGQKTEKFNTGFTIGETETDLADFMLNLSKSQVETAINNAQKRWSEVYCKFVEDFMANKYIPFISA